MPSHPQHQGILYLLPRTSDSAKMLLCGCSRKGCGGADACTGMCTCGTYNVYLWRGEEAIACPILQLSPYPSEKGSLSDSRAKPATMDFAATLHFHSSPLTGGLQAWWPGSAFNTGSGNSNSGMVVHQVPLCAVISPAPLKSLLSQCSTPSIISLEKTFLCLGCVAHPVNPGPAFFL